MCNTDSDEVPSFMTAVWYFHITYIKINVLFLSQVDC